MRLPAVRLCISLTAVLPIHHYYYIVLYSAARDRGESNLEWFCLTVALRSTGHPQCRRGAVV